MATNITDSANKMLGSIGAMQTLVENFPMNFISFGNMNFATSFDLLGILFKLFGIDREELIKTVTDALCGNMSDKYEDGGSGFLAVAEDVVKVALEANIINIMNCTTNPIISNDLLDSYVSNGVSYDGNGITLNVPEINFTGVLNRNPFSEVGSKFYFDVEDYNPNTIWKSKDFNAFLWYIINKSDGSQTKEIIWDNRYKQSDESKRKEIIRCVYVDEAYTNSDKIKIHICGARNNEPANYFKTRRVVKLGENTSIDLNKTIFEFNHDFLMSIKLYEPKVIVAEIVEYLLGSGNFSANLGLSINEEIVQGKLQQIIKKVIESDDTATSECYHTFSNEQYNEMLEQAERNRYNIVYNGTNSYEVDPGKVLSGLTEINASTTKHEYMTSLNKTLNDITAIPAQDPSSNLIYGLTYDWSFELMRALVYPFVRPLFTPKVLFLLLVNKKIMGSLTELKNVNFNDILDELLDTLFIIIKDIIIKLKDLIIEMLLDLILKYLSPLLAVFASRLLMEALKIYKDLLQQIYDCFNIVIINNRLYGNIDDVNYADIIPSQTSPNQDNLC